MSKTEKQILEEAARSVCGLCADGPLSEYDSVTSRYYHRNENGFFYNGGFCRANELRVKAETLKRQPEESK